MVEDIKLLAGERCAQRDEHREVSDVSRVQHDVSLESVAKFERP